MYKEAWPVVREWRELSKGHPVKGKTLDVDEAAGASSGARGQFAR